MADYTGQQLGNYRVTGLIGHGGFADVYLGEHIYLKTQVAIKVLQTKVANKEDLDVFLTEARTIAHLVHHNIVRVMDFGVDNETPFLVMDYAPSGTLRQRHPKGTKLPLDTIISYVKQVAAALQYAHDQKLIHRDVKPENMLGARNNDILLSDFGIALVAQSSRYQSTQDVVGTVAYMSPEQIQGRPRPASDQYSLGIVVYEWLSGDRPFHGSFTELCTQHVMAPPPPLREKNPTISPSVEQVVTIALAKDPKQRFGSVQAFAKALEQAGQSDQPTYLSPQSGSLPRSPLPPTQAVGTPPVLPTQYPGPAPYSLQQSGAIAPPPSPYPMQYPGYPAQMGMPPFGYIGYPAQVRPMPATGYKKVNLWGIGIPQLVAAGVGIVFYTVLTYLIDLLSVHFFNSPSNSPLTTPLFSANIGGALIFLSLLGILSSLVYVIPLFLGVVSGPWVGLFIAGVGSFLADYLSHFISVYGITWNWYVGYALTGFVVGFALLATQGRYNKASSFLIADSICAGALVLGNAFASVIDNQIMHVPTNFTLAEFINATVSEVIVALIVLPLLLLAYNAITKNKKYAWMP